MEFEQVVRKQIAKLLTVVNQQRREEAKTLLRSKDGLKKYNESKKTSYNRRYKALDARAKKTRAIRRRLTRHQAKALTVRENKKRMNNPAIVYAVQQ